MKKAEAYSPEKEKEVRKHWEKNRIQEKARQMNGEGKGFYMMDGPPYASGHIHLGTALNKVVKDVTIRQKRMQGFSVLDQPGYDTHGLPIENKVEKELGFETKEEIEKYGVDKFVEKCRKFATEYIGIMNEEFDNLGVWMDWENPYLTLDKEYIEAIWWTFKKADEKGLLYLGKYPIHACPRCETAVAYNEIEYTKQTDTAIYVKFKLKEGENKYLIIWTTTPWTLPSNSGVMVNPKYDYVEAEVMGETWVIAKERLQGLMDAIEAGYVVKREFKGKELEGKEYENPLAKNLKLEPMENAYKVIMSERYVNLEEGTGLVHTAPGCGKEDFDAGTKEGLPVVSIVGVNGLFSEEGGKYEGKKARVVDKEIIEDLEGMNALVYKHKYTHDYPVCWRCKAPLIMISAPQWFFRVGDLRKKMLKMNEEINWQPNWGKDRFRNWLESLGDWPVSRQRYWGTPLPIWLCDKECGEKVVVASEEELKKFCKNEIKDLHKPWIDKAEWKCKCGGTMKRVPEVLDVWFDSGVSSWGSIGYPKSKEKFEKYWPADFNVEGKDQIRGWWNSQLICSTICFDEKPYKAIAMHGMILDLGKKKMAKSEGNIVSPQEVIEKHNRDYLRFYLTQEFKGEDMVFDWNLFKEINRFFNVLWNTINYADTYLSLEVCGKEKAKPKEAEDKWIISRLNSLIKETRENYNSYNYSKVVSLTEHFVLEEFSRTYIKMVRDRAKDDKETLSKVFGECISGVLCLLAPVAPHICEHYYLAAKAKGAPESIHLCMMPEANEKHIDKALEEEMEKAKQLTQEALSMREEQKLRLRWPLEEMVFVSKEKAFPNTAGILAAACNVKKFSEAKEEPKGNYASREFSGGKIFLNIDANAELKEEWELMELRRRIQSMRKEMKLNPNDIVEMKLGSSDRGFLEKYLKEIEESTNAKITVCEGKGEKLLEREFSIEIKK